MGPPLPGALRKGLHWVKQRGEPLGLLVEGLFGAELVLLLARYTTGIAGCRLEAGWVQRLDWSLGLHSLDATVEWGRGVGS